MSDSTLPDFTGNNNSNSGKGKGKDDSRKAAPQVAPIQYFLNATKVDQAVLGVDGSSRLVPPMCYVHISQFGNPMLPLKCQRVGIFVGVRDSAKVKIAGDRDKKLVVGGPHNNARGHYHRDGSE